MSDKCPRCESPNPKWHPAVQYEGEVELCNHPWHQPTADEIRAKWQQSARSRSE